MSFSVQAFCISHTPQLLQTTSIYEIHNPILEISLIDEDDESVRA
jgi:hypothetical protein